jgi:hypothetical protein
VEVDLADLGPIFATVRLVVLAESMTRIASDRLHIFGNFHTFEPNLLRPKLPSANRGLDPMWDPHNPACISFINYVSSVLDKHLRSGDTKLRVYIIPLLL